MSAPTLDETQLAEILTLLRGADSAELKLTVPESLHRSAAAALGADPLEAQIRQVFFFDTPDLALDARGVVVRARRVQGRDHDSVVKLRPVGPDTLTEEQRRSPAVVVEVDAMPGGFVCSASCKGRVDPSAIRSAVAGKLPIKKLFSKEQRAFYTAYAPEGLGLDDLSVLGPIFVLKLKLAPKDLPRKLVAELWLYPDGSRVLELSTKAAPSDAFQAAAESRAYLASIGIPVTGEQQTKTRSALTFFSRELAEQGGAAAS